MNEKNIVLLVEDNPDDVALTLRAFKKMNLGNQVIVCKDGEEGLDFMFGKGKFLGRDVEEIPQVILLDLKLPKMGGLEFLRIIREEERTKFTPVAILTTSLEEEDMINGYLLGANSYVRKPVDYNQFASAIEKLGMYWLVLNEKPPKIRKVEK